MYTNRGLGCQNGNSGSSHPPGGHGEKYVTPALAEALANVVESGNPRPLHEGLSDREFQVMREIAAGKTLSQIAAEISLSVKTVSTYRARALEKMSMRTNAELTRYAIQNGLVLNCLSHLRGQAHRATDHLVEPDSDAVLMQFNMLIEEILGGTLYRSTFCPWEIGILVDLASCNERASSKCEGILRDYQNAVQRQMQEGARLPLKLSKYLACFPANRNRRKPFAVERATGAHA